MKARYFMKQRLISVLLVICLCASLIPAVYADSPTMEQCIDTNQLFEHCKSIYMVLEGNYDTVVPNDSNALSIGFMQWHASRALQLLKKICAAAPQRSKDILGTSFYNTIVNASSNAWSNFVPNSSQTAAIKTLIGTDVGRRIQDETARVEILEEAQHGWNRGVRSEAALLYYCAVENQYGIGNVRYFMSYVRETLANYFGVGENDPIATLNLFHNAVLKASEKYNSIRNYLISRKRVYSLIVDTLHLNPNGDGDPVTGFVDLGNLDATQYNAVVWAFTANPQIVSGTNATHFSPDAILTRAMAVTILWKAKGAPEPTSATCPFEDVSPDRYYYKPVLWAVENGITAGTDATHFSPKRECSRAAIVTFLYRVVGSPSVSGSLAFTDVKPDAYYRTPILWAVQNGIAAGTSGTTFSPKANCSRVDLVTFLYRAMTGRNLLPH